MKSSSIHSKPENNERINEHVRQLKFLSTQTNQELVERYVNGGEAKALWNITLRYVLRELKSRISLLIGIFTILTFPITCWIILFRVALKDRKVARKQLIRYNTMVRQKPVIKQDESVERLNNILE